MHTFKPIAMSYFIEEYETKLYRAKINIWSGHSIQTHINIHIYTLVGEADDSRHVRKFAFRKNTMFH